MESPIEQNLLAAFQAIRDSEFSTAFSSLGDFRHETRISVPALGEIETPLREEQARQLISLCRQAQGSDQASVQHAWELDADQFTFMCPKWPEHLDSICQGLAPKLGLGGEIRAQVNKMLICEKGAVFKLHTNPETIPGALATLTISLPSPFQGGDVFIHHGDGRKPFRSLDLDQWMYCRYSDVPHEVTEIESGYRWVLVCSLSLKESHSSLVTKSIDPMMKMIEQFLQTWLNESGKMRSASFKTLESNCMYHFLDHDDVGPGIPLDALNKRDYSIVQALNILSSRLPFEIFLALLDKEQVGTCKPLRFHFPPWHRYYTRDDSSDDDLNFHELKHVRATSYSVARLVGLDGSLVAENLGLDENCLLDRDGFNQVDPEEEYIDNDGQDCDPEATHLYSRTAFVIVPRNSLLSFLQQPVERGFTDNLIEYPVTPVGFLAKAASRPQAPAHYFDILVKFCRDIWNRKSGVNRMDDPAESFLTDEDYSATVSTALMLGQMEFFNEVMKKHCHDLEPDGVIDAIREWLDFTNPDSQSKFNKISPGLTILIGECPTLEQKITAILSFNKPSMTRDTSETDAHLDVPGFVSNWIHKSLQACLNSKVGIHSEAYGDGMALADAASFFEIPDQFLSESVIVALRENCKVPKFLLGAAAGFHRRHKQLAAKPAANIMREHSQIAARLFISETNFAELTEPGFYDDHNDEALVRFFNAGDLEETFTSFFELNSVKEDLTTAFIAKLDVAISSVPTESLLNLWIPFLCDIPRVLHFKNLQLDDPFYQKLYTNVFTRLVNGYMGQKPSGGAFPSGARVKCDCQRCTDLNAFLADPEMKECGFSLGKEKRKHVRRQLEQDSIDCVHKTIINKFPPHTLVVTKISTQDAKEHANWSFRKENVLKIFKKFLPADLKMLLGSKYTTLCNLSPVLETPAPLSEGAGSSNNQGVTSQVLEAKPSLHGNARSSSHEATEQGPPEASAVRHKTNHHDGSAPLSENARSSKRGPTEQESPERSGMGKRRKGGCSKHENCVLTALFGTQFHH